MFEYVLNYYLVQKYGIFRGFFSELHRINILIQGLNDMFNN